MEEPEFTFLNPSFHLLGVPVDGYEVVEGEDLNTGKKRRFVFPRGPEVREYDPMSAERLLIDFVGRGDEPKTREQGIILTESELISFVKRYGVPFTEPFTPAGDKEVVFNSISMKGLSSFQRHITGIFRLSDMVLRRAYKSLQPLVEEKQGRVFLRDDRRDFLKIDTGSPYASRRLKMEMTLDERRLTVAEMALQQEINRHIQGHIRLLYNEEGKYSLRFCPDSLASVLWLRLARFLAGEEMFPRKFGQKRTVTMRRCVLCGTWDFGLALYRTGEHRGEYYHRSCNDSRRVIEWRVKRKDSSDD